ETWPPATRGGCAVMRTGIYGVLSVKRRTEPNVMFRLWPLRYVLPHAAARSTETSLSSVWTVVARKPSPGSHAAATVTTRSSVVEWLGRQTLGHSEWRR